MISSPIAQAVGDFFREERREIVENRRAFFHFLIYKSKFERIIYQRRKNAQKVGVQMGQIGEIGLEGLFCIAFFAL